MNTRTQTAGELWMPDVYRDPSGAMIRVPVTVVGAEALPTFCVPYHAAIINLVS
jgi:hypothetical protein